MRTSRPEPRPTAIGRVARAGLAPLTLTAALMFAAEGTSFAAAEATTNQPTTANQPAPAPVQKTATAPAKTNVAPVANAPAKVQTAAAAKTPVASTPTKTAPVATPTKTAPVASTPTKPGPVAGTPAKPAPVAVAPAKPGTAPTAAPTKNPNAPVANATKNANAPVASVPAKNPKSFPARAVSMRPGAVTLHAAATPVVSGATVNAASGPQRPHLEDRIAYQYNALGRRDPFQALVGGGFVGDDVGGDAPPDVGGIKVVGIVWGVSDKFALVEDGRGNSLVLRQGDKVMNGVVSGLRRDALLVSITQDGQTESVAIPLTRKGESNGNR